jgi:hypothetical protein
MQTDEGAGAAGVGAGANHEGEQAPSIPPIDPPIPPASTTDESVPPEHPAPEPGSVLRWMKQEDLLSVERVGVMCNKNDSHWILLVATGIANLIKDPPERCVISTLDSLNGDNSYEACIFREFLKMYIHHHTGRTITDDLFIIYKVIVPGFCIQRDGVNCGIILGVYVTNMFDPTCSIQHSVVKGATRDNIIKIRRKFYEFLRDKHQNNIDNGSYHSEFYNVHSDNGSFVSHHQIPASDTCVICSASDLNGRDTVDIGLRELARVNPLYEDWLNDIIVQYFYFNKLNLMQNRTRRVFRCFSTYFITRMMREYQLDRSHCGYTTATAPVSVTMSASAASCTNSRSEQQAAAAGAAGRSSRQEQQAGAAGRSSSSRNVSYGPFPDPHIVNELIQHQENDDFVRKQREKFDPRGVNKLKSVKDEVHSKINNVGASLTAMLDDVQAFSGSSLSMKDSSKEYLQKSFEEQVDLLADFEEQAASISMPGLSDDILLSTRAQLAKEAQKKIQDHIDGKLPQKKIQDLIDEIDQIDGKPPRKRPREDNDEEEEEAKQFCMDIVAQNGFGHLL